MVCSNLQMYKVNYAKYHGLCSDHLSDALGVVISCEICKSKVPVLFHQRIYCESCNSKCPEAFSKCNHHICEKCFKKTGECLQCKMENKSNYNYCFEKEDSDSLKKSEINNSQQKIDKFDIGDDYISQDLEKLDYQDKKDNNVKVPALKVMHPINNIDNVETEITSSRPKGKEIEENKQINEKLEEKSKNRHSKENKRQAREEVKEEIREDKNDYSFIVTENNRTYVFEMPPQEDATRFDFKNICKRFCMCFKII